MLVGLLAVLSSPAQATSTSSTTLDVPITFKADWEKYTYSPEFDYYFYTTTLKARVDQPYTISIQSYLTYPWQWSFPVTTTDQVTLTLDGIRPWFIGVMDVSSSYLFNSVDMYRQMGDPQCGVLGQPYRGPIWSAELVDIAIGPQVIFSNTMTIPVYLHLSQQNPSGYIGVYGPLQPGESLTVPTNLLPNWSGESWVSTGSTQYPICSIAHWDFRQWQLDPPTPTETPTETPTATPQPTETPLPTATPQPTNTPTPAAWTQLGRSCTEYVSSVNAGEMVHAVSGGLMSSTPYHWQVSPYGETSRPSGWYLEGTSYTDGSGNICVPVFQTATSDWGTFLVTVNSLDANQRQYNPASLGITVVGQPTPTPTATPAADPWIDTVYPMEANYGDVVTINGANFMPSGVDVTSLKAYLMMPGGGTYLLASVTSPYVEGTGWSDSAITFRVNDTIPRTGSISVVVNGRVANWNGVFTMNANAPTATPTPAFTASIWTEPAGPGRYWLKARFEGPTPFVYRSDAPWTSTCGMIGLPTGFTSPSQQVVEMRWSIQAPTGFSGPCTITGNAYRYMQDASPVYFTTTLIVGEVYNVYLPSVQKP